MLRLTAAVIAAIALLLGGWYVMSRSDTTPESQAQARDEFGGDRPVPPAEIRFEGKRALKYLQAVCDIGPRISGTSGMQKQQALLQKHFEALGGKVELQSFEARQRSRGETVKMANLIVSWFPERPRRVIFCCHYDTRPIADQEEEERRWREPFVSANDGGSGVAWMMELAHHMKDLKTNVGVDFVIFDGEEYVFDKDDSYFFGSQFFAQAYRKRDGEKKATKYLAAVLLDMIGGKGARFPVERNSWRLAEGLVRELWGTAGELKSPVFVDAMSEYAVEDDHLALNQVAGIPTVDLIDFSYPHWHRLSDTPDKCSAEALEQVAKVLLLWVQRAK